MLNRRNFLTATIGATAASVAERKFVAPTSRQISPYDITSICRRWFTGELDLTDISQVAECATLQAWGDLPSITDKMFRQLIMARPDLKWCRIISPRWTFDIYESDSNPCDLDTAKPPLKPYLVPAANLPVSYYLRNGSAPDRLEYVIRHIGLDLCYQAHEWYKSNPHLQDCACFVPPVMVFKQEGFLLDMFCYSHLFVSTDETHEQILVSLKKAE